MNTADFEENVIAESRSKIKGERELKAGKKPSFCFVLKATLESDRNLRDIDISKANDRVVFLQNLKYWNDMTNIMSVNNFDNSYFESIVKMGRNAVPFIVEELEKKPTPLVHALDMIFPGVVKYNGYISLKDACDTWLSILKKTGKNL